MMHVEDNVLSRSSFPNPSAIDSEDTDVVIQRCLNRLARTADDLDAPDIVRELLSVAATKILILCESTLSRSYPRLARGPLNIRADELLSAVAERLIKAMRKVRPIVVRDFFALAKVHIRWELNGLARQLDAHRHETL